MNPGFCSQDAYGHPVCRYCQDAPMRVRGSEIFPEHPRAAPMHYLRCRPCNAYVRCHDGTWDPMGELGDPSVRRARKYANDAVETLLKRVMAANRWPEDIVREALRSWFGSEGASTRPLAGLEIMECQRIQELCAVPSPPLAIHVYKVSEPRRVEAAKKNRRPSIKK